MLHDQVRTMAGCEKLTFFTFNFQYLKNIAYDVFLFINYEDLRKNTIPSTVLRHSVNSYKLSKGMF